MALFAIYPNAKEWTVLCGIITFHAGTAIEQGSRQIELLYAIS